ncbi:site-specific integrase [Carboxylicivirga sediminis]|uniref:Site-specific integrase n=1 Tax=Carboxylicivirga sediminis TaxID=2006564 RepID=A0A941F134_9BACT|nr:site-specific integrase [Carboxylicivirga sediminis]MBR8534933.1 site-specific integrase [Carboxylicivirga sediminis]
MKARTELRLRKSYSRQDGSHPIHLRLTINRQSRYFSLKVYCKEENWLKEKQEVSSTVENSAIINLKISDAKTRVKAILNDFTRFNKPPTFLEFTNKFRGNFSKDNFYAFALSYIKNHEELSANTRRSYKSQLTKLNNHTRIKNLSLAEVNNLDFIQGYKNYMHTTLENKTNTITKSLGFIKAVLNEAIRNDLLDTNVFNKIKLSKVPSKREYLTSYEIELLEKYYSSSKIPKGEKNVLRYFLFSCYTGLRFMDVKQLTPKHIISNSILSNENGSVDDWKTVEKQMHKTKIDVVIPLTKKALSYLPSYEPTAQQPIFRVISNQKTNKTLRKSITKCKIDKASNISFHCARHSFATNTLHKGVALKYVSKMLGHTEIKTTELYTKPNKHYLIDAMRVLDQ